MLFGIGFKFDIEDLKNYFGIVCFVVFIGFYQIEVDFLMLGIMFLQYCSVMVKIQFKKILFLGWFMILSGVVFIDCKNFKDV